MADKKFTPDQEKAIIASGSDILVSAAAGSGKTAVLVERIVRKVTEQEVDVDRLLVVTFTEAAATQMRQRLYQAVSERIRQTNDEAAKARLRRQQLLLPNANITTIHSFCLNLIRRYCHLLELDPAFKVADVTQTALMKPEVMRETFEEWYSRGDVGFLELVEIYGNAVKDDALQELVMDVYEFSRACPFPERYLAEWAGIFTLGDNDFHDTKWFRFMMEDAAQSLKSAAGMLEKAISLSDNPNIHQKYIELLVCEMNCTNKAINACGEGIKELREAINFPFDRLPGSKSKMMDGFMSDDEVKALKERIQALRKGAKDVITKLKEALFFKPLDEQFEDIRKNAGVVSALVGLVNDFSVRFSAAKREKNVVDFNDFEHFCLQLLEDDEIAAEVRAGFEEVMIDEYQDSNLVQETILLKVSNGQRGNRFMVGDIKQSIYRFRMANPDLFREKYVTYAKEDPADGQGLLIDLSMNFRSQAVILDSVNFIFKQLMTEELGEVDYKDAAELKAPDGVGAGGKTEVHIIDVTENEEDSVDNITELDSEIDNIDKYEVEARVVARRIQELISEGIYDAGDIVVLMRSTGASGVFADELAKAGIAAYDSAAKGFFDSAEMLTIINFLKIIDNPRQDIPLAAVLYSPLFMFGLDELVNIRRAGQGVLYDCLMGYGLDDNGETSVKIADFLMKLSDWRRLAVYSPVSELIWAICHESGYYDFVGAIDGGNVRQANLNRLFEQAVMYERVDRKGLFNFIKHIEKLQKEGVEVGEGTGLENNDAVKIMSIHKSKGLEFPVVFVCGLGRRFNLMDARSGFTMHRDLGFGTFNVDLTARIKTPTLNHYAVKRKILRESLSEELRVLYVALTRAKEKLILTGTVGERKRQLADAASATSFMDWVLMALERRNEMEATHLFDVFTKTKGDFKAERQNKIDKNAETVELLRKIGYNGQNDYIYPLSRLAEVPSKMSVTEVKRLFYRELIKDSVEMDERLEITFDEPAFISGESEPLAARKGIVMHTVLERIDFNEHTAEAGIKAIVADLEVRRIIRPEEVGFVNIKAIERFLNTPLAERIRLSKFVRKEVRFVANSEPSRLNPGWIDIDEREIMLHGVIDLIFEENGEIVIVDYKTDKVTYGGVTEKAEQYRLQIELYTRAVEKYYGKRVKERVLYFFDKDVDVMV